MSDTDLLFMPATRAAALIRAKKLSPVEYVDAVLGAIADAQPHLNCFVTVMDEAARRDAKAAEQLVMDGAPLGPLHGVPVTVKDLIDVAGVRTTNGSAIYADNIAAADDILVTRLRAAGTVIVGKSTTPEFGNKGITDGPSFGTTRNPWDLSRTTGGSSGGAAACVAAGLGPIALGTDGAGSVRIPAACCGLVGHKPTLGLIPIDGARDAFFNYTYAGPLSRTVTDAAVMHAALVGPGRGDPWSFGAQPRPLSPSLIGNDLSGLRVGFIEHAANPRVAADMLAATRDSLAALADAGADVEDVTETVDWIELPGRIMYQTNFTVFCEEFLPHWQNQMDPTVLAYMQRGSGFDMKQLRSAQYARTALFRAVEALLARYDVLVTPTLSRTALPADFDAANDQVMVDGVPCGITRQGWTSYVYPFNLTGHPALTVPSGFGTDGLPTSTQIIGRWGADMDVFRIGAVLEQARPWAMHKPSFMK